MCVLTDTIKNNKKKLTKDVSSHKHHTLPYLRKRISRHLS